MLKQKTQKLLEKNGIIPNKALGQNFLINEDATKKLLDAAKISKNNIVVEVGPGTGNITGELAKRAKKVIAVEKDKGLVKLLQAELKEWDNVEIINGDILNFKIENLGLFKNWKSEIRNSGYIVIGAIPYYLTGRLFRHFSEETEQPPKTISVIIQKDIAVRVVAKHPHSNLLAVSIQLYGKPQVARAVSKSAFWPQPKVSSAILVIENIQKPADVNEKRFFCVLRAGFSSPRKQLAVNLSRELKIPRSKAEEVLRESSINPKTRAESLSVEQWKTLARTFTK